MATISVPLVHDSYSSAELASAVSDILVSNELAAMATVRGNSSYIHTAYYVHTAALTLYFISQPNDIHIVNIAENSSIAAAIWCPSDEWSEDLRGLQLFGTCEALPLISREAVHAMMLFMKRFPAFARYIKKPGEFAEDVSLRLYALRTSRLKIIHEPLLGRRQFVTVDVPLSRKRRG